MKELAGDILLYQRMLHWQHHMRLFFLLKYG